MTPGLKLRGIATIGKSGRFPLYDHLYEEERLLWEAAGKHAEALEAQNSELQGQIEVLREGSLRQAIVSVGRARWNECELSMGKDVRLVISGVAEKKQWRWSLMATYDDDYASVDLAMGECGKVKDLDAARVVAERGARAYLETLLGVLSDGRCKSA